MTRSSIIAPGAVLLLFAGLCAVIGPIHHDRAFVTYRFAENVAGGHGFVYNPGDAPLEGYDNTAWVVACALLARTGASLPQVAWVLSLLAGVVALMLAWSALRARAGPLVSFAAAGFIGLSGPLAIASMSGQGAAFIAALAMGMVVLLDRARDSRPAWIAAGLTGALLAACGHALALVFPVAVVVRWRRTETSRDGAWTACLVYLFALAAFHAWRLHTFGSLTAPAPGFDLARATLWTLFVSQPYDMAPFGLFYLALGVAALAGVAGRGQPSVASLACATALAVGIVTLGADDPLPGLAGSAALVPLLVLPVALLVARMPRAVRSRALDGAALAALLIVALAGAMDLRVFARHIEDSHDHALAPLGRWKAAWRSNGTMLCDRPGAVAYYSGWRTAVVGGKVALSGEPDAVLLTAQGLFVPDMQPASQAVAASLAGRYRVVAGLRRDWTRDRALILYVHQSVPPLSDEEFASFPNGIGSVARVFR